MRLVPLILGCALPLAGCGAGIPGSAQSEVGRNFDALASAVAGCADVLQQCGDDDDAGKTESAKCRDEFLQCRGRAGMSAESELAEAIGKCQEAHHECEADAGESACAQELHACIGEARAQAKVTSDAAAPNSHAPTYQCFGQLRECVMSASEPRECAAQARACVITAVGDPPAAHRPSGMQPPAAGSGGSRGEAGKGAAGRGEAGKAGTGGAGAAGTRPMAGTGGAGGMPAEPADCMAQHEACLMGGEEPKKCSRELRMCGKPKP